jgi:glutamine amidotransferase
VHPTLDSVLFENQAGAQVMYFVHSYYAPIGPETIAQTGYDVEFSAAVRRQNLLGVQFHPEKSHEAGMALLARFAGLGNT